MNQPPLVVDLDGTLIQSDLLVESAVGFLRAKPLQGYKLLYWLLLGKAHLKDQIAQRIEVDVAHLPYNQRVISLLKEKKAQGQSIILATATHKTYADQIATHLGLFDRVLATEQGINLSARHKRDRLVKEFGEHGFDYVGNSHDDVVVWKSARHAYLVDPHWGVESKAASIGRVAQVLPKNEPKRGAWFKALRIHQWVKNLLIFVPLLASHRIAEPELILKGFFAYLYFGLCASSVYLLNDIVDLEDDRHHATKRHRPFASGKLTLQSGLILCPLLLIAAFSGALLTLPWQFAGVLAAYYVITLAYSFFLKRRMVIDVITLAGLYTLRIIAGIFAFSISLTFWMLAFSMFIFLSMAFVKRYAELKEAKKQGKTEKTRGRGYYPDDLEMVASLGAAAGYISVMVLALYIQDAATVALYRRPELIWLACPLMLFWISRIWLITHRGLMHEDPVVFAVKDKVSLGIGLLFGLIFWLAA